VGRPKSAVRRPKSEVRRLTEAVTVRFTETQLATLAKEAESRNVSLPELLRESVLARVCGAPPVQVAS
jgi:hypothetical protein